MTILVTGCHDCPLCGKKHTKVISVNEMCLECSKYFNQTEQITIKKKEDETNDMIQEYIKKEADKYAEGFRMTVEYSSWYHQKTEPYASGLSAGIELAKEFAEFSYMYCITVRDGIWLCSIEKYKEKEITTSELFEIFLTERNEK